MVPPGPGGYMEGIRPYFLSMGQSAGPMRSNPLIPRRAASRQQSSRLMLAWKHAACDALFYAPFPRRGRHRGLGIGGLCECGGNGQS